MRDWSFIQNGILKPKVETYCSLKLVSIKVLPFLSFSKMPSDSFNCSCNSTCLCWAISRAWLWSSATDSDSVRNLSWSTVTFSWIMSHWWISLLWTSYPTWSTFTCASFSSFLDLRMEISWLNCLFIVSWSFSSFLNASDWTWDNLAPVFSCSLSVWTSKKIVHPLPKYLSSLSPTFLQCNSQINSLCW